MRSLIFILLSLPSLAFAHFTGQLYDHHHPGEIPYLNELLLSQQPSSQASPLEIFEPLTLEYDPNIAQMIQTMDVNVFHDIIKRLSGVLPLRDGEKPIENRFSRFEDIRRAGDWLAERFKSFGLEVRFHEYDPRTTFGEIASLYRHNPQFQPTLRKIKEVLEGNGWDKWRNVVASIPGVFPNKRIIVGAHYDSIVDWGKNPFQPGADDNASGTAALLLMAEAFMRAGI
ncbi:MAG TPA: M28 family peptidase, partial [Bdellovibrionota bacterium]|nr:M28 family peptidase [Bdellovibrionota bacterium]